MACIAETELQQTSTQANDSGTMGQGATQTTETEQSKANGQIPQVLLPAPSNGWQAHQPIIQLCSVTPQLLILCNVQDYMQAHPTTTAAAPAVITVSYITGWSRVMMHYSADGQGIHTLWNSAHILSADIVDFASLI